MAKKNKQTVQLIDGVDPDFLVKSIQAVTIVMRILGVRTSLIVLPQLRLWRI